MVAMKTVFEVPVHLQMGLASGVLERVGGIVRDAATKRIVAWLRDSAVEQISQGMTILPNPVSAVLRVAQIGFSLWDGHQTRQVVEAVSQQVTRLTQLTMAGQVINLAMSGLSFVVILQRLERLRQDIGKMQATIQQEFKRDRDNSFQVALEAASDAWSLTDKTQRDFAARSAIDNLKRARNDFLMDFQEIMSRDLENRDRLKLAQSQLQRAIYAQVAVARCYWATDNADMAIQQLKEQIPSFRTNVSNLIHAWFLPNPAMHLEVSIPRQNLAQFFEIQHWMRGKTSPITAQSMFDIIDELRRDFFRPEIFGNTIQRTLRPDSWRNPLLEDLQSSLALIENFQRLEGYELEIRSARLSLDEWEKQVDQEQLAQYGGAILIDEEGLAEAASRIS